MTLRLPAPFLLPDPMPDRADLFLPIATGLANEVADWCEESARLTPEEQGGWDDTGGVFVGLLVRVQKMLHRMAEAIAAGDGECAEIFARCIFESVVNARVLLNAGENLEEKARRFVETGYKVEERIRLALEAKGPSRLSVEEQQVLDGLQDWVATNGIPNRVGSFGPMNERLSQSSLDGQSEIYWWAMPSQAVHGTWSNLQVYHLEQTDRRLWVPKFETSAPSPVLPMAMVEHAWALVVDDLHLRVPSELPLVTEWVDHTSKRIKKAHEGLTRAQGVAGDP